MLDIQRQSSGVSLAPRRYEVPKSQAVTVFIQSAQRERFSNELDCLLHGERIPDSSPVSNLSPFVDRAGLLRVGGRLKHASMPFNHKHPLLLPYNHIVTKRILGQIHEEVEHQGAHLTHGAVRSKGYHIEKGRQMVRALIQSCVCCRRLRAPTSSQLMADLPHDRLEDVPPFSNVGIDCFGPYYVHDGQCTRRTKATKKMWVLIVVCLTRRAIHLEMFP